MPIKSPDCPFYETAEDAEKWVKKGCTVFQKFSCEKCGSRQTMENPNAFHTKGRCEECGHVSDLIENGCNYILFGGGDVVLPDLFKRK
jgi:hypothetical protein